MTLQKTPRVAFAVAGMRHKAERFARCSPKIQGTHRAPICGLIGGRPREVLKEGSRPHSARRASRASGRKPAAFARRRRGLRPFAVYGPRPTTTQAERPGTCASLDVRPLRHRAMYLRSRDAPRPKTTPTRLRFADATTDRAVSRPTARKLVEPL